MHLKGEWDFINDPKSEKFQAIDLMASIYYGRNNEELDHFNRLKTLSANLSIKLKESLRLESTE